MAVYGRFRERWDPTKIKSKVSKNRTFELGNTLETGKLLYWMNVESIENDHVFGNEAEGGSGLVDVFLNVFGDVDSDGNLVSSISTVPVTSAHFQPKGLQFGKTPNDDRVYVQSDENAMDVSATDLLKSTKTYDTWISFWVKVSQKNYNESLGHNMGGLYRSISTSAVEQGPTATLTLNPAVLFGITTSGAPELRLQHPGTTSNKLYYTGPTGDNDKKIEDDQWTHVTWLIKPVASGGGQKLYSQMVDLWIDGTKLTVTGNLDSALSFFLNDVNRLEVLLGNQTRGYAADGTDVAGEGFFGSIAEFMVFTYPTGDSSSRSDLAKFLYEAQREGAYHLHSGIHSSSPRLEQLDLDNDSSYPPNFSMPAYTVFDKSGYYEQDPQVSLRSNNRYTEGYNPAETWEEKAGKYYVQSNNVIPHLRLDPTDTLLTNGNWYSDARSEFFAEDLDPADGFVVPDQSSDELYREHVTTTSIPAYRDSTVGEEYKDCFVIEIPLPNASALQLGTDQVSGGVQERSGDLQTDAQHSFNTMAYYNFKDGQWEYTVPTQVSGNTADDQGILNGWDIGFGPMTGLVLPSDGRYLERFMDLYGRPMTFCGFPFHRKFEANEGQTIDLSKYIDGPVILEGWEINTDVVPRVGYQHNLDATGTENNTADGPSGFYDSGLVKNPFWYGAHGEAAVIWDMDNYASPFEERKLLSTHPRNNSGDEYQPNGTIPIGPLPTKGAESMSNQGVITKGVTAFLLKETYAPDGPRQKSKWANNPHYLGLGLFNSASPEGSGVIVGDYSVAAYNEGEQQTYSLFENMFDPIGTAYTNPSQYDNGSTREIIGYLQHVYHNDPTFETVRTDWQRKFLNGDNDPVTGEDLVSNYGLRPRWRGFSFASLLNRESYTYVDPDDGNLLRENTKEYPLHVSGSMKIQTNYAGAYPISLFYKSSNTNDTLESFDWKGNNEDTATGNAQSFNYSIFPSSEGSISNEFIQYDSLPVIGGKGRSEVIPLPKQTIPNVERHTGTIASWKEASVFDDLEVSINPDPDADIVLDPSDKLILGIQDSVSTTFMSQQSNNASSFSEHGFVRWGRNALTISETTSGYLRLYVRKTRNDKPYNVVSDESNYNQNVNRDLGDHDIGDRYQVQDPKMLSGSMADDIVGPTTFTPPIFSVDVVVDSLSNISCCAGQNVNPYSWGNTVNKAQSFWSSSIWNHTTALYHENFSIPWYAASAVIFADRDQGDVFPRYPSIPWEDDILPDLNRYQWYNFSEMWQWPLAGLGDTQSDGAASPYGWQSETLTKSFRYRMFATVDEINPNSNALTSGLVINGNNTDVTRYGPRSPARSSWTLNIILPVFRKVDPYVSPFVSALPVEVRIVKIIEDDWYLNGGGSAVKESDSGNGLYIRAARYTDGTKMSVGDVFWFDPNGDCVKLDLDLDISVTIPDNQKVLRNFIQQTPSGAKLFVVGGAQDVAALGPDLLKSESNNGRGILTFKNVYSIISRLLSIHCEWDESILPVVKDGWDGDWTKIGDHSGSFSLVIPQDPAIRSILSKYQDIINASISFRLCGVKIEQDTPVGAEPNSVIDNFIRLHKDISLNGAFKALTNADFDGDFGTDDGVLLSQDTVTHNIQRTNFLADYLLPFTNGTYDNGVPVTDLTGTQITKTMFEIDYTDLPRVVPQLRIVSETYSETVGRKIDRSVQRRSTVENTDPKLGILSPGPFGSLKRYTTLSGNVPIFDSLAPSSLVQLDKGYCSSFLHDTKQECESAHQDQWVSTSYITTIVDKPQQFPHEINENKSKMSVQELRIKMNTSVEGGISDINSSTNDYTNYIDNNVGEWTWQYATDSSNLFDKNGLGLLEVSNYIQENFSGIGDYQQKTINDYLMGFGNGVQGKITLRPRLYDYLAWTGDEPESFSVKFLVDPPRGSRFGLYNTSPQKSNYIFSYNHFGHLRDMLEQGTDTKFLGFEKDEKVYGSPVIVNPINPTNSEIPKLMENTSRYNKTANATIVKPYIEDNYEAIPNPVNLKAETLRVDVAGSIKTKSVLAPGNVASNIRRR